MKLANRFELERRGYAVNRKRVQRLMREDDLLCVRRRKFVVTADSNHNRPVYPNLAVKLVVTRVGQLWVADIPTFGWALDRTPEV